MSMDEIWKIADTDSFIAALADHVMQKCEYGDNMSGLRHPERVFYIAQICEMEVNNGGFAQFFYNSSGDFASEVVDAFREIGAPKTAELCEKALGAFGQALPADREARQELLDKLESDEIDCILDACDHAFYQYEEDLNACNCAYAMKHRADFS